MKKSTLLAILKSLLKFILKLVVSNYGLKGWIIKKVLHEFFSQAGYHYEIEEGKHVLKEIEDAKDSAV